MVVLSPILNRELLTFLRTRRAFGGLLLFLLVLSVSVGVCWWSGVERSGAVNRDIVSRQLFHTVFLAQLFIFSAYALVFTCTRINSERDTKTFDLLASLPLSSVHIVLAKYGAALVVILLLICATAPFLSLCFLFGGVGWREALSAYCILIATVLSYGMLGVACSAVCRRGHVALFAGFLAALTFYIGIPALVVFVVNVFVEDLISNTTMEAIAFHTLQTASPLVTYGMECTDMFGRVRSTLSSALLYHASFAFFLFLVSFLVAWYGLRAMAEGRQKPARERRWRSVPSARQGAVETQVVVPLQRRRFKPIGDRINPVYAREDRSFFASRWRYRLIGCIPAALVFLAMWVIMRTGLAWGSSRTYRFEWQMCQLGLVMTCVVCLLVPLVAARAITVEREMRTLPLLTATPLRPWQILLGKMAALLKRAFRAQVVFLFVALFVLWGVRVPGGLWQILRDMIKILLPIFAITVFVASIGMLSSVLCRKTVTAIMLTYGIIVALAFSPAMLWAVTYYSYRALHFTWIEFAEPLFVFFCPILSPGLYFMEGTRMEPWDHNDRWTTIAAYVIVMLAVSTWILAHAAQKLGRESRTRT